MEELITIIINVYNGEKFIKKCLDCILNQTYKNLEVLIINDGSTDNTLKICESYIDNRIRIINQENKGVTIAKNVGIDNAKGKYLYFIDADDFIEKDTIEYLYNLIKNNNAEMATAKRKDIFDYNFNYKNKKEKIEIFSKKEMLKKDLLGIDSVVVMTNKLIKKEVFDDLRLEPRITDDIAFTYKLILKCEKIVFSNQIKYFYLRNLNSITGINNKKDPKRYIDEYNAVLEKFDYINKIYPNLLENHICVLRYVTKYYAIDNEILYKYLEEQNAKKVFKEHFKLGILTCKMRFLEKLKILLFRLNSNLSIYCTRKYQSFRFKKIYKM